MSYTFDRSLRSYLSEELTRSDVLTPEDVAALQFLTKLEEYYPNAAFNNIVSTLRKNDEPWVQKGNAFFEYKVYKFAFFQRDRRTGFDCIGRFWAFHRHNVALRRCFRQKQCDVRRIAVGDVTEFPGRLASLQLFPARMGSKFWPRNETATTSSSRVAAPKRLVDADVSNSASQ